MKSLIHPACVSLCLLVFFVANQSVAAPRLFCDAPKYDFGTVIGQDEITHEFILTNEGDEPVRISNIKNCCGVASTIEPMVVLPGSNAVCSSVFTTKNRYGVQEKQILIASNDRKNPYYELKFVGTLLKPVEVSPRYLRLGDLLPDSVIHQTITASNLLEQTVTLDSVQSTVKGIVAEVVSGTGDSTRSWTITLHADDALRVGKLNGQIRLNFSSGMVNVPILGTVKPVIQAVPEHIQFSTRSATSTERLIMLRSGDGRPFEVLSASLENGVGEVNAKKLGDDRWQLKLSIVPEALSDASSIQIQTSCKSQPIITVPLSVR